jgi:hypothetical protein
MTAARRLIRYHRMEALREQMVGFLSSSLTDELTQQIVRECAAAARRGRRRSWRAWFGKAGL